MRNLTAALAILLIGCTGANGPSLMLDEQGQPLEGQNGLTANGLVSNGLTANGLTANGLTVNGLTVNGLGAADFATWFTSNSTGFSAMVMKYIVKCALPADASLSYTAPDGTTYTWNGELGLAPVWSQGNPIPVAEQQLISACLAGHTNKFGLHVSLSMRGYFEDGTELPYTSDEEAAYPFKEGCFFGNLFDGTGVFAGYEDSMLQPGQTSPRACAAFDGQPGDCPPMVNVGSCASSCTPAAGSDSGVWGSCTVGGVDYLPMTTRIGPGDVYQCGDGVCQFTESCYDAITGSGCLADCGLCY